MPRNPKSTHIGIRAHKPLRDAVDAVAERHGLKYSEWLTDLLMEHPEVKRELERLEKEAA